MITLKKVMRANAASCIIFSLVFLLIPAESAEFLGADKPAPDIVLLALGLGLLTNGLHLFWASFQPLPSKNLVLYFSAGDFIWVIASISLVLLGVWITTGAGIAAALIVATVVAALGVLQMITRKNMGHC